MDSTCLACNQTDDHPKHRISNKEGPQKAFHMDCHALLGCEICLHQTQNQGDLRGDDFRAQLVEYGEIRAYLLETGEGSFDNDGLLIPGSLNNG